MQVFVVFSLIVVLWSVYGYSLAFTEGNAFFGSFDRLFLKGTFDSAKGEFAMAATFSKNTPLYELVYIAFQATFAAITVCLILGGFAERMKFSAVLLFAALWFTFSYCPVAHMVWYWAGPDAYTAANVVDATNAKAGFIWQMGALDFAGGTVVHISAGVSALVAARMLGPRRDFKRTAIVPHNVPLVLLGAGLLWFGWFGFNAGSALAANGLAALAFTNTNTAAAMALVTWACLDLVRSGKVTAVGAATGLVVGLVGITPAAGYITAPASLAVGAVSALVSYTAIQIRSTTRLDDSLDVFSCHGLAGMAGAMLTGVFATKLANPAGGDGWLAGNFAQMGIQLVAVLATVVLAATGTAVIMLIVKATVGVKADVRAQLRGLDLSEHGEEAYFGEQGAIAGSGTALGESVIVSSVPATPLEAPAVS